MSAGKDIVKLSLPATRERLASLEPGTRVLLSGTVYTARDQAHKRLAAAINAGEPTPVPLKDAAIYYCGPTPANGGIIGACGPTTSGRMDAYAPLLIEHGVTVMIGKGVRSKEVTDSIVSHGAAYLCAIGGAAALYRSRVKKCELVAYPDLGCESAYRLEIEDFPAVVAICSRGTGDIV